MTNFVIEPSALNGDGRATFSFQWNDSSATEQTTYELWVDEVLPGGRRNSRVYYEDNLSTLSASTGVANTMQRTSTVAFAPGNYIGFIRSHGTDGAGFWHRFNVQIDDDGDSSTALNNIERPTTPNVTVIREGQGWYGQTSSESRIGWVSDDVLHDIWLNKRNDEGRWERYRLLKNVSGSSIAFRELAAAHADGWATYFGQIDSNASDFLETGDYRFFIRSVNRAADNNGTWIGTSSWSSPVDFSYQRVEGADAKPENLVATDELRTEISWDPVDAAEGYLVSIWKGPNYSSNTPIYIRTPETRLTADLLEFNSSSQTISVEPGDEFFVKVRGIGQDGSPIAFQAGNFASTTIRIPNEQSVQNLAAATPLLPSQPTGSQRPILEWTDVGNAESYEVWLSSLETGRRVLLAQEITSPRLQLDNSVLEQHLSGTVDSSVYSTTEGLAAGSYRYWVRAHSRIASSAPTWSSGHVFTVQPDADQVLNVDSNGSPDQQQLISPNLVIDHSDNGRSFLLVTNGKGESFGKSVLAKYEVAENGIPFRPTVDDGTGRPTLEFPDLPMGSNVTDMKTLPDGRVAVLSRGSSELRLIDPVTWTVVSTGSLLDSSDAEAPDAIGMEILDNNQILVVFNRSDRLRIFDATTNQLAETNVTPNDNHGGFLLPTGRGVHVSAVPLEDSVYRLFIATPGIHAVTVYDYDSAALSLTRVHESNDQPLVVSRSQTANPFLGGTMVPLQDPSGETKDVFLSADRSGFVTWIDAESLQYGFIDLADWMPWADRNPGSDIYVDPDDNSFDTTRITAFGHQQVAVFSNRANSVMLQLQMSAQGNVTVVPDSPSDLFRGTSGTVVSTATGFRLFSTAKAPVDSKVSNGVEGRQLTVTTLNTVAGTTYHAPGESTEIVVSNPIKTAHEIGDQLLIQSADSAWKILTSPSTEKSWDITQWPTELAWQDRLLTFRTGPSSTWFHEATETHYAVVAVNDPAEPNPVTPVIALLKINSQNLPELQTVYRIPEMQRVFSADLSEDALILIDRRGGESVTIRNWRDPDQTARQKYEFHSTRESESGAIRPGHGIALNDQTIAMVHDTYPDRGISLFSGQPRTPAIFHPNTTGTFSFDLHRYDDDRIIMATYGGDLVIQNAATGIVEVDRSLNLLEGTNIQLTAVENSSYENGILTVASPANQMVAVFRTEQNGSQWDVTPLRVFQTPDIVRSIIRNGCVWIIEANRVRRIKLSG